MWHVVVVDDDVDLSRLSDAWSDVRDSPEAAELVTELRREVTPGHPLFARPVLAVAVRRLRKEVVFSLPDRTWAWVHLTWSQESDPRWPSVAVCWSWSELVDLLRDMERG